jgi:hypothetical protein
MCESNQYPYMACKLLILLVITRRLILYKYTFDKYFSYFTLLPNTLRKVEVLQFFI